VSAGYWILGTGIGGTALLPASHDDFVQSFKPRSLDDFWALTS
jgi:hypothetical protein